MSAVRSSGILLLSFVLLSFCYSRQKNLKVLSYKLDPRKVELRFFLADEKGKKYRSIGNLKRALEEKGQRLLFAMNGGMYQVDGTPVGLYIENYSLIKPINKRDGSGNFYMKPNGVFYLDRKNKAGICITEKYSNSLKAKYATQSGPMLLYEGKIHSEFKEGSANVNIRNGVGILEDGNVIFAMSEEPVNFYDFAMWFREQKCIHALYLDGAVSRTYFPEKSATDLGGNFGVIIGVSGRK